MVKRVYLLGLLLCLPVMSSAGEQQFPTATTVLFVLNCMSDLGGVRDENMYTCVCRHDAMQEAISHSDYEEAVTYERNRAMPGKKGGFFRDNARGKKMYEKLLKARSTVDSRCVQVRHIAPPGRTDTPDRSG